MTMTNHPIVARECAVAAGGGEIQAVGDGASCDKDSLFN